MPTDRICHYTNLESLALILKTRRIRFTRMDRVDDIREAQQHLGIEFGKYFFVSCWTIDTKESIPQWNMYSDQMRGVRIECPAFPLRSIPLQPKPGWTGIDWRGMLPSPIPFEDLWGSTYFVVPIFLKRDHFSGPMNYVDDVESLYKASLWREVRRESNSQTLHIANLPQLPRNKSKDWEFQKEFRFSLFILPSLAIPEAGPGQGDFAANAGAYMSQAFLSNVDPGITHFDVALDPAALEELAVRTGPLATAGTIATVEALLAKFAPSARVESSALSGLIRGRS